MIKQQLLSALLATLAIAAFVAPAGAQIQPVTTRYRITMTNITKGQIISPAVVATHTQGAAPLFTLGRPASEELAQVAEDAVLQPLFDALSADSGVMDVQILASEAGPILPGMSASVEVEAPSPFLWVSAAAMLVTTNDAFTAVNSVRGPNLGTAVVMAPAYDAGSEANTESCEDIPGPPCGNPGNRVTDGAEGYVYISNGIAGEGDITASGYDWHNPRRAIRDSSDSVARRFHWRA